MLPILGSRVQSLLHLPPRFTRCSGFILLLRVRLIASIAGQPPPACWFFVIGSTWNSTGVSTRVRGNSPGAGCRDFVDDAIEGPSADRRGFSRALWQCCNLPLS